MIKPFDLNPINRIYGKVGAVAPVAIDRLESPSIVADGNDVTMTAGTGATIKYTDDAGENWYTYTEKITITEDTTITAYATMEGHDDSKKVTVELEYEEPVEDED